MKKSSFIKPLVIAATVTALTAATAISSIAATQPQIVEIDGKKWEVYQQDEFRGVAKLIDDDEEIQKAPNKVPSVDELTLISTDEYVEGDYRYVTGLYEEESVERTTFKRLWGWKNVYYEPNGILLAKMWIRADFYRSEEQGVIFVDEDTILCETEKLIDQTYPIITESKPTYASNQGGYWGGQKYAYAGYKIDMEKAKGVHSTHSIELVMNVLGEAHVN